MKLRVLIIEDSENDAELLVRELCRCGFDPLFRRVDSGLEMAAALADEHWDIILADYVMPGFSGLAALRLLQERGYDIPFIILSGKVGEDEAVAAMKAGAHDYLVKGHLARLAPAIMRELAEAKVRRLRGQAEENLRHALGRVQQEKAKSEAIIAAIGDGVTIIDTEFRVIYQNQIHKDMFGDHAGDYCYEVYEHMDHVCPVCPVAMAFTDSLIHTVEKETACSPGITHLEITASPLRDENGGIMAGIEVVRDVSERHKIEEKFRFMSTHDSLTGLYNRAFFDGEMARLELGRQFPVSIIVADVDGLKIVNDRQGHGAGDRLLQATAQILKAAFRAEDLVARVGGDEFAVLLVGSDKQARVEALDRVRMILADYNLSKSDFMLSLSLGGATANQGGHLDETYRAADNRMYRDKLRHAGTRQDS